MQIRAAWRSPKVRSGGCRKCDCCLGSSRGRARSHHRTWSCPGTALSAAIATLYIAIELMTGTFCSQLHFCTSYRPSSRTPTHFIAISLPHLLTPFHAPPQMLLGPPTAQHSAPLLSQQSSVQQASQTQSLLLIRPPDPAVPTIPSCEVSGRVFAVSRGRYDIDGEERMSGVGTQFSYGEVTFHNVGEDAVSR